MQYAVLGCAIATVIASFVLLNKLYKFFQQKVTEFESKKPKMPPPPPKGSVKRQRINIQQNTNRNVFPESLRILGFNTIPSKDDLKTRFKQLSRQNHPDLGGDADEFDKINKAYREALVIVEQVDSNSYPY